MFWRLLWLWRLGWSGFDGRLLDRDLLRCWLCLRWRRGGRHRLGRRGCGLDGRRLGRRPWRLGRRRRCGWRGLLRDALLLPCVFFAAGCGFSGFRFRAPQGEEGLLLHGSRTARRISQFCSAQRCRNPQRRCCTGQSDWWAARRLTILICSEIGGWKNPFCLQAGERAATRCGTPLLRLPEVAGANGRREFDTMLVFGHRVCEPRGDAGRRRARPPLLQSASATVLRHPYGKQALRRAAQSLHDETAVTRR